MPSSTKRERHTHTHTQRERDTHTHTHTERDTERDTERHRERERDHGGTRIQFFKNPISFTKIWHDRKNTQARKQKLTPSMPFSGFGEPGYSNSPKWSRLMM